MKEPTASFEKAAKYLLFSEPPASGVINGTVGRNVVPQVLQKMVAA